ncbi:MAG: anhydro-N-acetylmuramic acid kinase [Rhodospirillaceae bacterium]|nr:anhydro-N-acetylmuramic acid kinase [Rhodospirillaceae bacterium]
MQRSDTPVSGPIRAIGLMSGTSCDGIDAALIETDGEQMLRTGPGLTTPYDRPFAAKLTGLMAGEGDAAEIEAELTRRHADLVRTLLKTARLEASDVALVGFHGQTIRHEPHRRRTWQIGDGALLAALTGIDVINDFRTADVVAGGQGAPFAPLYHAALAGALERPLAVLNLGGVGNVTWIGSGDVLLAFDTGPGNALIDDWCRARIGESCDHGGRLAASGRVDEGVLARMMDHSYFMAPAPKSLDRNDFTLDLAHSLSTADGAATLTEFTAASVAAALAQMPAAPRRWLVTGGGRHNPTIMAALARRLGVPVDPVESVGWDGDLIEAQAFGYLAVRSLRGLPLSVPGTTGVPVPTEGGRLHARPVA